MRIERVLKSDFREKSMNTFGRNIKITVFGQSHAKSIGVTIDGLAAGTIIDEEYVQNILDLRAPGKSDMSTKRKEPDKVEFISGVVDGKSCGTSISAVIYNNDTRSKDYSELLNKPRPSHADYPAMVRYADSYDIRGGGQFSGRLTAPICIAGGIALKLLEEKGIKVACHINSIGNIKDSSFDYLEDEIELMDKLNMMPFAVIDEKKAEKMHECVTEAAKRGDSVGGTVECKITGLPVGLGEPMFCGIENAISQVIFGVPAVKGIEFGAGFEGSGMYGSQYNDAYYYAQNGKVRTKSNNAGGICAGMATGMPVIFRVVMKPTPSISLEQETVNLKTGENVKLQITGRHDPCIVPRANVVIRAAAALAIYDLMLDFDLK